MKMSVLSWSEITANAIANYFNKAGFLQNVSLEEDENFNKLKLSLNQCQQHNKDCVSEDFSNDNLLTVKILLQQMEEGILREICENKTVQEEEEDKNNEDVTAAVSMQQDHNNNKTKVKSPDWNTL